MTRNVTLWSKHAGSGEDWLAADLRGFGPIGILAILVIILSGNVTVGNMAALPAGAALVCVWTWRSHTPWSAIGYVRPTSWTGSLVAGIAFGTAFKILMKMVVMPLLGADPINHAYHFLAGNRAMLPAAVWAMLVAGFGEETVFRGYLFERASTFARTSTCTKLFGSGASAKAAIVLVTAGFFGLARYPDQGLAGAEQGAITGLVFGSIFALTGRIFFLMVAHAAFDLTALAIIYWNAESKVAHFVFG
jgi:membrane protease YdiL (CAAX protease family)